MLNKFKLSLIVFIGVAIGVIYIVTSLISDDSVFRVALSVIVFVFLNLMIAIIVFISRKYKSSLEDDVESKTKDFIHRIEELNSINHSKDDEIKRMTYELQDTFIKLTSAQTKLLESEKNSAMIRLIADISNDVNTPIGVSLTAMTYASNSLKSIMDRVSSKNEFLSSQLSDLNDSINMSVDNLVKASNLLDNYQKMISDQRDKEKRTIQLKIYIREILEPYRAKLDINDNELRVTGPSGLTYYTNPSNFYQIFDHLVGNSILHGFDQLNNKTITIRITAEIENIAIIYEDNGHGIEPSIMDQIFDPHFTTKFGQGGTGLGLYVVKKIVQDELKGTIELESTLGQYTRCIIKFPYSDKKE